MIVSELIDLLRQYPAGLRNFESSRPKARGAIEANLTRLGFGGTNDDTGPDGYDDLSPEQISTAKITLNTGRHRWEGRHGDLSDLSGRPQDDAEIVDALVLRRTSH